MTPPGLEARGLHAGHGGRAVLRGIDIAFPPGDFSVIVGANACGKSTLLRVLARLLRPTAGTVTLEGEDITRLKPRDLARRLALLPQQAEAPDGIIVQDLVGRGRHPHQTLFRQWSVQDETAVAAAMAATGITSLAERPVQELSGGQRQKVWIAMALAQDTGILLLDEPTTYLDLAHQIEVLDLCRALHRRGKTLVCVLHDLNQACRYATHLVVMKEGAILAEGAPGAIVTADLVEAAFGLHCLVMPDPLTGTPMIVPRPSAA
ncbi:ABC transporter ATP-binding protein [Xanthobacteraceae bacterium A53D]